MLYQRGLKMSFFGGMPINSFWPLVCLIRWVPVMTSLDTNISGFLCDVSTHRPPPSLNTVSNSEFLKPWSMRTDIYFPNTSRITNMCLLCILNTSVCTWCTKSIQQEWECVCVVYQKFTCCEFCVIFLPNSCVPLLPVYPGTGRIRKYWSVTWPK